MVIKYNWSLEGGVYDLFDINDDNSVFIMITSLRERTIQLFIDVKASNFSSTIHYPNTMAYPYNVQPTHSMQYPQTTQNSNTMQYPNNTQYGNIETNTQPFIGLSSHTMSGKVVGETDEESGESEERNEESDDSSDEDDGVEPEIDIDNVINMTNNNVE